MKRPKPAPRPLMAQSYEPGPAPVATAPELGQMSAEQFTANLQRLGIELSVIDGRIVATGAGVSPVLEREIEKRKRAILVSGCIDGIS